MKQELYIVSLPDYSVSPIISGATKEYIGTKEDIDDVIQDGEVVIAKQGVVLSETTYYCLAAEHTFINTYGFDYTIKTEKTEAVIVYQHPKALLAVVLTLPAKLAHGDTVSLIQKQRPFLFPLFTHSWHFHHLP